MLEELEHAKKRGATIYAEINGYGMSADAYHMTLPSETGEGASRCMTLALNDAELDPTKIDYINAHGTSTPAGDILELKAVKKTFNDHSKNLIINSSKSMIGHLLGAAGGVEAIVCILSILPFFLVIPVTSQFWRISTPNESAALAYPQATASCLAFPARL